MRKVDGLILTSCKVDSFENEACSFNSNYFNGSIKYIYSYLCMFIPLISGFMFHQAEKSEEHF